MRMNLYAKKWDSMLSALSPVLLLLLAGFVAKLGVAAQLFHIAN